MNSETGIYYNRELYAGIWRRIFVDLIDVAFIFGLSIFVEVIISEMIPPDDNLDKVVFLVWLTLWIGYFVVLKGSKYRTLGYIIGGIKVVNLQGKRPSMLSLCLRFMFAVLGPFNMLLDLFWIPDDPHRQALRDKVAHTYVVRRCAEIAGSGKITYRYYYILGWSFLFQEVEIQAGQSLQAEAAEPRR